MDKPLTELEKVAIFFLAIGPERAEVLLKRLGTDAMMQIAATMKRLSPVSSREKQGGRNRLFYVRCWILWLADSRTTHLEIKGIPWSMRRQNRSIQKTSSWEGCPTSSKRMSM